MGINSPKINILSGLLKKISTPVNLKLLVTNLTCFSFSQNLLLILSNFKWHQKNKFFRRTISAKCTILDVWQGSEYANEYAEKYLQNNYWWVFQSFEIKRCIGVKWITFFLNIHVFISYYNSSSLSLIFQAQRHCFFIWNNINSIDTATFQNICWLRLFSKCAKQNFCFIGNAVSVSHNSYLQRHIQNRCLNLMELFLPK